MRWIREHEDAYIRKYDKYQDYVEHQQSKSKRRELSGVDMNDLKFREELSKRLLRILNRDDEKVLCLGARTGDEVITFRDLGFDAIGVDLYPTKGSKHVIKADFHNLPFADNSMGIVYTNSIDHINDESKFFGEIVRVLKLGGILIAECVIADTPGEWESYYWKSSKSLTKTIESYGLKLTHIVPMQYPWHGNHMEFELK